MIFRNFSIFKYVQRFMTILRRCLECVQWGISLTSNRYCQFLPLLHLFLFASSPTFNSAYKRHSYSYLSYHYWQSSSVDLDLCSKDILILSEATTNVKSFKFHSFLCCLCLISHVVCMGQKDIFSDRPWDSELFLHFDLSTSLEKIFSSDSNKYKPYT